MTNNDVHLILLFLSIFVLMVAPPLVFIILGLWLMFANIEIEVENED